MIEEQEVALSHRPKKEGAPWEKLFSLISVDAYGILPDFLDFEAF